MANVLVLSIVGFGWLTEGPRSFHAQYLRDARVGLTRMVPAPLLTEAELARLPGPIKRYLRVELVDVLMRAHLPRASRSLRRFPRYREFFAMRGRERGDMRLFVVAAFVQSKWTAPSRCTAAPLRGPDDRVRPANDIE